MNVNILSFLCIIVNIDCVSVTIPSQVIDKDLESLIQRYLDAKKLYHLVQENTDKVKNGEIAAADNDINRLLKEIYRTKLLDTRTHLKRSAIAARMWDLGGDPGAKGTDTTPFPNTTPETTTPMTTTTTAIASTTTFWFEGK